MQLTFTDAAKERVEKYLGPDKKLLLSIDDGVGPFSKMGTCAQGGAFQLIVVNKRAHFTDFDAVLDSNLGPVEYKGYSKDQMDPAMKIGFNKTYFTMPMTSANGTLTDNVELRDFSDQEVEAGGKIAGQIGC